MAEKHATPKAPAAPAQTNGAVLFEKMDKGFTIPPRVNGGQWNDVVRKVAQTKGETFRLYKTDKDNVQSTYTRAKSVRQAAKRLNIKLTIAVRLMEVEGKQMSCLLVQAS